MQPEDTDEQASSQPAPPARRLYREPEERRLAGVCGGLADYFGLDPTVVRLMVVVLTLANGMAVVAYLIAVCVVPLRPPSVPRVQAEPAIRLGGNRNPNWLLLLFAVLVAGVLAARDSWWIGGPSFGVLLVAFGVWLLLRQDRDDSGPILDTTSGEATTLAGEAASDRDLQDGDAPWTTVPSSESGHRAGPQGEVPPPIPPWGPTKRAKTSFGAKRQPFQTALWAILLIGVGVVALLAVIRAVDGLGGTLGAVLVVMGLLLIVGAWKGRSRFLIALGLPLLCLLVLADLIDLPVNGAITEREVDVVSTSELNDSHELLGGKLTLDLDNSAFTTNSTRTLSADVGVGSLVVFVPDDVTAEVDADVGVGEVEVGSQVEGGTDIERTLTLPGTGSDPHRIRLDLHVGVGKVEVHHG